MSSFQPLLPFDTPDVTDWEYVSPGQAGAMEKDWIRDPQSGVEYLAKMESDRYPALWMECVAHLLALQLGIPSVPYSIATRGERSCVICPKLNSAEQRLVLGGALIGIRSVGSGGERRVEEADYTLSRVFAFMRANNIASPHGAFSSGAECFASYLMLDALIANQDRHHGNWGVVYRDDGGQAFLAPSFDHLSSLGNNLPAGKRDRIQSDEDLERFLRRAKTPFRDSRDQSRPRFRTVDAAVRGFELAGFSSPPECLGRLRDLDKERIESCFYDALTDPSQHLAGEFGVRMVLGNRNRLLAALPNE